MKLTKTQLREIIREEVEMIYDKSTRRPTDAEFKTANDFAKKKGGSLDAIGVDIRSGKIYAEVSKKGNRVEFTLDKRGNIIDVELPF